MPSREKSRFRSGEKAVRAEKAYAAEEIGKLIDGSSSLILTTFTGVDSTRMNTLRRKIKQKSSRYFVVKNRTFAIAARQRGLEGLCGFLTGQVGVVFGEDDSFEVLKSVVNFGRENKELKILGGFFEGQVRSASEMLAIAAMPPRDVAAGQLVSMLGSPLSELVRMMSELVRSFVFVIGSVAEKKESSGSE